MKDNKVTPQDTDDRNSAWRGLPLAKLLEPKDEKNRQIPQESITTRPVDRRAASRRAGGNRKPATALMKTVAAKAPNMKNMKKVFSPGEIDEIMDKRETMLAAAEPEPEGKKALRDKYRRIKMFALDMEKTNRDRLIVFPSLIGGDGWYKMANTSALYYAYRLATRMGRKATVVPDSDKFLRARYTVSLVQIERFIEQFAALENDAKPEITPDGIYVFPLKRPLSDDDLGQLKQVEATRHEKLHSLLRPRAMDPGLFNAIMTVDRQVLPRIRKLERPYFEACGIDIVRGVTKMLTLYMQMADGLIERAVAGRAIIGAVDSMLAAVAVLSEVAVWPYDVAASIGENINSVKLLVAKEFKIQIGE